MATRSALYIPHPTDDDAWLEIYCHYDGYPSHMIPALAKANIDALIEAECLRGIDDDGRPEPMGGTFRKVRIPTRPTWADHVYVLTATGWIHTTTGTAAAKAGQA